MGPAGPACCAVSHAPGKGGSRQLLELLFKAVSACVVRTGKGGSRKASRASFLRASESNVRQWQTEPCRTRGWDQQALLFRCFACARQRWQSAASRATFLRASESNVRQWRLALGHAVGTSRPCCFACARQRWQPAALRAILFEGLQKATLGTGAVARRPGPSLRALLFRCFACARQRWQPAASRATFLRASESNVRQWRLALGHAVGTSRPCCFAVSHAPGKGGSRQLQSYFSKGFRTRR